MPSATMPGTFGLVIHLLALVTTTTLAARIGDAEVSIAKKAAPAPALFCCCKSANEHYDGVALVFETETKKSATFTFQQAAQKYLEQQNQKGKGVCKNTQDESKQTSHIGVLKVFNVNETLAGATKGHGLNLKCCRFKDKGHKGGDCTSFYGGSIREPEEAYCKPIGGHDRGAEMEVERARDDVREEQEFHNEIQTSIEGHMEEVKDYLNQGYTEMKKAFGVLGVFADAVFESADARRGLGLLAGATLFGLSVAIPPALALEAVGAGWFCFLAVWDAAKAVRHSASAGEVIGNFVLSITLSGVSSFLGVSIPATSVQNFWTAYEAAKGTGLSDVGEGIAGLLCSVVAATGSYNGPFTVELHKPPPPKEKVLTAIEQQRAQVEAYFANQAAAVSAGEQQRNDKMAAAAKKRAAFFDTRKKPAEPTAEEKEMAQRYADAVATALQAAKDAGMVPVDAGSAVKDYIASMFTCGGSDMVKVKVGAAPSSKWWWEK